MEDRPCQPRVDVGGADERAGADQSGDEDVAVTVAVDVASGVDRVAELVTRDEPVVRPDHRTRSTGVDPDLARVGAPGRVEERGAHREVRYFVAIDVADGSHGVAELVTRVAAVVDVRLGLRRGGHGQAGQGENTRQCGDHGREVGQ